MISNLGKPFVGHFDYFVCFGISELAGLRFYGRRAIEPAWSVLAFSNLIPCLWPARVYYGIRVESLT